MPKNRSKKDNSRDSPILRMQDMLRVVPNGIVISDGDLEEIYGEEMYGTG